MDVETLVQRYEALDGAGERQLLSNLLRQGWEPGCWIRPDPERLIIATQAEVEQLLERLRRRPSFQREAIEDPFPNGRDCDRIEGEDACLVVLAQRCDIVGLLKNEPLVELAHATYCTDRVRIKQAWKNSPREFPVDPQASETHLVDIRYRYFISKLDMAELTPRQALPRDTPEWSVRVRFGLRTSQRYTRAAIPDQLMSAVVNPLYEIIKGDGTANELFSEWVLFYGDDQSAKPGIRAYYQAPSHAPGTSDIERANAEDAVRIAAEDKFEAIISALPDGTQAELDLDDDHRTRAIDERELTVADWRLSWKLEWDYESFTGHAGAALPAR
jgi:hypothetical protein